MSYNDRCGEALAILEHDGILPVTPAVRDALMDWLQAGRDGLGGPPRGLTDAIRRHPDNADLLAQTGNGEWIGDDQ